jgi:hypothetical protein
MLSHAGPSQTSSEGDKLSGSELQVVALAQGVVRARSTWSLFAHCSSALSSACTQRRLPRFVLNAKAAQNMPVSFLDSERMTCGTSSVFDDLVVGVEAEYVDAGVVVIAGPRLRRPPSIVASDGHGYDPLKQCRTRSSDTGSQRSTRQMSTR